jgi:hypothetical protein
MSFDAHVNFPTGFDVSSQFIFQSFKSSVVEHAVSLNNVQAADGAAELVADEVEADVGGGVLAFVADFSLQRFALSSVRGGSQVAAGVDGAGMGVCHPSMAFEVVTCERPE